MIEQNTLRRRGTGLIAADPAAASPGYTLFAPLTGTGQVYLARLDGTVAHQWDLPYRPGRHARLLPNGNLAYNGALPAVPGRVPGPGAAPPAAPLPAGTMAFDQRPLPAGGRHRCRQPAQRLRRDHHRPG